MRTKIYANLYWKEHCFGLTAKTLVDKAMQLTHVGGTYGGNRKPTKFMCLILKMLQIQPEKEIIIEFIKNEDHKYVRVLGAFYLRLIGRPADVYKYLEPLYNDYLKVRHRTPSGWELKHVDEFIDELLTGDYSCDIALPRLPKRWHLEDLGLLTERRNNVEDLEDSDDDEDGDVAVDDAGDGIVADLVASKNGGGKGDEHDAGSKAREPSAEQQHTAEPPSRNTSKDGAKDVERSRVDRGRSPGRPERDRGRSRSADRDRGRTRDDDERQAGRRSASPQRAGRSRRSRSNSRSRSRSRSRRHRSSRSPRSREHERERASRRHRSRSRSNSRGRRHGRRRSHSRSHSNSRSHSRSRSRSSGSSSASEHSLPRSHSPSPSPARPTAPPEVSERTEKKKKNKSTKGSKLFSKKPATEAKEHDIPEAEASGGGDLSVAQWNDLRAKLNMPALR